MIAIIITIMVLELKVPHGADLGALRPLLPMFLTYVLSFIYLGIYWNNHHHMLHATERVNGAILWANLHLLFWLSLVPFATGWMGENHFAPPPTAALRRRAAHGRHRLLRPLQRVDHRAPRSGPCSRPPRLRLEGKLRRSFSSWPSRFSFADPWITIAIYVFVFCFWFIPDRRIERLFAQTASERGHSN